MAKNKKTNKYQPIAFGALPVDYINVTLGMELEVGNVVMSANAQKHAANKHPEFSQCLAFVSAILASPLYLGDDLQNDGKIEIIGKPHLLGFAMLIAVEVRRDKKGHYNISSVYSLPEDRIQNRKEKGYLKIAVNKK